MIVVRTFPPQGKRTRPPGKSSKNAGTSKAGKSFPDRIFIPVRPIGCIFEG